MIGQVNNPLGAFTMASNQIIRDKMLGGLARSLFLFLASQSESWRLYGGVDGLRKFYPKDSRTKLRAAFAELEAFGYVTREHVSDGRNGTRLILTLNHNPTAGDPTAGDPTAGRARDNKKTNPKKTNSKEYRNVKGSSSSERVRENPEAVNTESKEIEHPKSPVVQDKGSSSMARDADPPPADFDYGYERHTRSKVTNADPAPPQPPGTPETKRGRLPKAKRWTYDGLAPVLLEHIPRAAADPMRLLWIVDHWTEPEIREALRLTARADRPCWGYLCKVLTGLDETPKQKSRRKDGGGVKAPAEVRFDQETLQWVEVTS